MSTMHIGAWVASPADSSHRVDLVDLRRKLTSSLEEG